MNPIRRHLLTLAAPLLLVLAAGCSERDITGLKVARATIDPLVFDDAYSPDVYFQGFSGTYYEAVSIDSVYAFEGQASLKVIVPPRGSSLGAYAGGVLTSAGSRDLADFNALTLYARSSVDCKLNVAGFGNDNTGNSLYEAGRQDIPLTPEWTFLVIPIPSPSKLIAERGLFTFAEAWEDTVNGLGHEVWFDEIRYAKLGNITDPRSRMTSRLKQYFVGATAGLGGTFTIFDVDGANVVVHHMPNYFDWESSDATVAAVVGSQIRIVGVGNATITATIEGRPVSGSMYLTGLTPPPSAAPRPTLPANDVISMFSGVYNDVPVDSWNPGWAYSTAEVADYEVEGDVTKMYTSLNFVGIDFLTHMIDATGMTHLHLDLYAPAGTNFKVKIIAYDRNYDGVGEPPASVEEVELTFDAESTPPFVAGGWSSLDIPLADYGFSVPLDHVGLLALSTTDAPTVLMDNLYWHR